MSTKLEIKPWAMLAVSIDDVEAVPFPILVQPKLNGVRAMWDCERKLLISRQCKVWPKHVLPHIYEKLKNSPYNLDGELYCHAMRFQDIAGRVNAARKKTADDIQRIEFVGFDIILGNSIQERMKILAGISEDLSIARVSHAVAYDQKQIDQWLMCHLQDGHEGIMLKRLGCPYMEGRTEALIKVKPWKYKSVYILNCIEGLGKFKNALGAFQVTTHKNSDPITADNTWSTFKVGGGNISEDQRRAIWQHRQIWKDQSITIRYRELSRAGIPLQPQIYEL